MYICVGAVDLALFLRFSEKKYYEYILKSENRIRLEMIRQIKCHILDHNCDPINIG